MHKVLLVVASIIRPYANVHLNSKFIFINLALLFKGRLSLKKPKRTFTPRCHGDRSVIWQPKVVLVVTSITRPLPFKGHYSFKKEIDHYLSGTFIQMTFQSKEA